MEATLRPVYRGGAFALAAFGASGPNAVNEEVADDDSTFLYGNSGLGTQDFSSSFTTDWDVTAGGIVKVTTYIRCRKHDGTVSVGNAYTYIRNSSNEEAFGSSNALGTSYAEYNTEYSTSPFTGSAWTSEELEGLQIGVKLETDSEGSNPANPGAVKCTQIWAVIEYTQLVKKLVIPSGQKLTIPAGSKVTLGEL